MEIMARRVEWQEAVRRQRTGTLHATIDEALDKGEPWVEWHELPFDNFSLCGDLADAYESLRSHLSPDARESADTLLGVLFWSWNDGVFPNDLGEEPSPDAFYCSLSPERVASLAAASRRLPAPALAAAAKACTEDVWEDCSYEDDFVPFLDQLRALFERAARDGHGVLIFVG